MDKCSHEDGHRTREKWIEGKVVAGLVPAEMRALSIRGDGAADLENRKVSSRERSLWLIESRSTIIKLKGRILLNEIHG